MKTLIQKIEEKLPRKISGKNKEYCEGYNDCRDSVVESIPHILEVVKEEYCIKD